MLKDITIGQYFPGSSPVHRMDPRFKIIMTLLFIAMLFMGQHLYSILFGVVFCILALSFSKIPVRLIWKSIKPLIPVLMITAVLDLLMVDSGDVYWKWHFLKLTEGGVRTAILMVTRIIVLLAGSSLLTYTTSPIALTDAIERLLSPLKKLHVPVHTFAGTGADSGSAAGVLFSPCRRACNGNGVPVLSWRGRAHQDAPAPCGEPGLYRNDSHSAAVCCGSCCQNHLVRRHFHERNAVRDNRLRKTRKEKRRKIGFAAVVLHPDAAFGGGICPAAGTPLWRQTNTGDRFLASILSVSAAAA